MSITQLDAPNNITPRKIQRLFIKNNYDNFIKIDTPPPLPADSHFTIIFPYY